MKTITSFHVLDWHKYVAEGQVIKERRNQSKANALSSWTGTRNYSLDEEEGTVYVSESNILKYIQG